MGNSASSVHKKLRCPRCYKPFKTDHAIVMHQEVDPSKCINDQPPVETDDISKPDWAQIERDLSRNGFEQLPQDVREKIDKWVSVNVVAYAPNTPMAKRKSELRKWYMIWRILYPTTNIPCHPCIV